MAAACFPDPPRFPGYGPAVRRPWYGRRKEGKGDTGNFLDSLHSMDNLSAVISFPRFIRDLAMPRASRAAAGGFCYLALSRGRERIQTRMNGITTCTSQNVPPGFIAGSSGPGGPRGLLPWGSHGSVRALSGIRLFIS